MAERKAAAILLEGHASAWPYAIMADAQKRIPPKNAFIRRQCGYNIWKVL